MTGHPRGAAGRPGFGQQASRALRALRTVLFWCHLTTGVVIGIVVLIMSVTGVLLAYQRQVLDWAASRHRAPFATANRVSLDAVVARARAEVQDRQVVSVAVSADSLAPVSVGFEDRRNVFIDPYTGNIVGNDAALRAFFGAVERRHRSLALGSLPGPGIGKTITGASNLAFLFLILSGLYLWWPRQWSARAFRTILFFNRGARGKVRDWNWHHVLGFWCAPVLVLIVVTGAFISYSWPSALVGRLLGDAPPREAESRGEPAGSGRQGRGAQASSPPLVIQASFDSLWSDAMTRVPGWRSIQMRLPRAPKRPVTVVVSTGSVRPDQRSQGTFDATTGALIEWQTYRDAGPARRLRSWIRPLHTGEAGGVAGQTVAATASGAVMLLVCTGLMLAWRRFRSRPRRSGVSVAPDVRPMRRTINS